MKIKVGVSNRHIHLSIEDLNKLFGYNYNLTIKRELSQNKNYVCFETVDIINNDKVIEKVKVVGPTRDYTQLEISKEDAEYLGINPPYKNSGDLLGAVDVKIKGPNGIVERKCCILANRHIHINQELCNSLNLKNDDIVKVKLDNNILDNVHIKISDSEYPEMHIDVEDAKKYNLNNGDIVELLL